MAPDRIAVQYTAAVASDSDVVRLANLMCTSTLKLIGDNSICFCH